MRASAPSKSKTAAQLQGLVKPALLAACGLLALISAAFIWIGFDGLRAEPAGGDLIGARDQVVIQLGQRANELRSQFESAVVEPYLRADVQAGARDEAAERLRKHWPALSFAKIFSPQLETAVGEGADGGFGRLALVGQALVEPGVALGVVGKGETRLTGMALAIAESDQAPQAVAYVELPFSVFADAVSAIDAGGGYLELRLETEALITQGDPDLRAIALPQPIRGTPFQLAVALPQSMSGTSPLTSLIIGALAAVVSVLAFSLSRRVVFGAAEAPDEPTFAEALAGEHAAAAVVAAAVASKVAAATPQRAAAVAVNRSIFRAYDIRGVLGQTLDASVARLIGLAVGSVMRDKGLREIVVGRDGRLSGPELSAALIDGLRATGCDVIDIGQAATPVVYFASYHLHAGSCIAVTGSHNPPDYNGFKIVVGGDTLSGDAIQNLYERIAENTLASGPQGGLQTMDVSRDYIDRIASDVQLERRMRVVVDCGNGVPGAVAPEVLEAIGCDAEALYCEVDGTFPNHHPDPSDPDNLRDLITAVQRTRAELGLAFDGDGDRLGVVTASGRIIYPDRVLMLFAQDVLSRNPGAAVIYDVKCTGHLSGQILRHGGSPIMWKTGHSLIKAKMRETAAELAGEMSGHFFFKERWYGFDDGIYAAARLLEILAADDRDPEEIFAELPDSVSTPELKIEMEEGDHYAFMETFRERARFEGAKIVTIDGVRADWPDGWGLVRCSNTTPCLVLRFDSDSEAGLKRIQAAFRAQIEATRPGLALPF